MFTVDLNADIGESFGAYTIGRDADIIPLVTSVNIACGMHAGDPSVMDRTVEAAVRAGVSIGAHPGYPDLPGFGRRHMSLTPADAADVVLYQVGALDAFVRRHGGALRHVKLHGALYNDAAKDGSLADAVCRALFAAYPDCAFYGLAGSAMLLSAKNAGLAAVSEAYADRAYMPDGSLMPRSRPGSVIRDPAETAARCLRMVREGSVPCAEGAPVPIRADSICVHGDNESALAIVKAVRAALEEGGARLGPPWAQKR